MLVAKPFVGYDMLPVSAPRVISEVRKSDVAVARETTLRPRISGNLLVGIGLDTTLKSRKVLVRGGYLHLMALARNTEGQSCPGFRVPLRHLSIRAGPLVNSLCLVQAQTVLLTLQMPTDRLFEIWIKTLAIEIIRQTPLEAVKYLDILTLTDPKNRTRYESTTTVVVDANHNNTTNTNEINTYCAICPQISQPTPPHTDINRNVLSFANQNTTSDCPKVKTVGGGGDPYRVAVILKKCQSAENYVPVREKLMLFESLCRIGRRVVVDSTNTIVATSATTTTGTKRARSMHDLTYCFTNAGVREICKYFERKTDDVGGYGSIARADRRLINSDSNLSGGVRVKFTRTLESHA